MYKLNRRFPDGYTIDGNVPRQVKHHVEASLSLGLNPKATRYAQWLLGVVKQDLQEQ